MGLRANLMFVKRSLTRRKAKNLSAILAITLGVTLMVGIQITTDTLENSFLTSLLQTEGEVDIRVSNSTTGGYLTSADAESIKALIPHAVGVMPELTTQAPVMVGSQFNPSVGIAGISLDFPESFGTFYDWKTGEEMDISTYLTDNSSVLMSSRLAENLNLDQETDLPFTLRTEFTNITVTITFNQTSGTPIITPVYAIERVDLSVVGIFNGNRPGIGSQYGNILFALEHLQDWMSLEDPTREKDRIGTYLIALKTGHFNEEIDEDYLKAEVKALEDVIPEKVDPLTGQPMKVYSVDSPRILFFQIAGLIFNLMSTMLTTLGLLIAITGVLLITNVQLMSVEDREFQTGVLRAVGENRRGIFQSMLIETLFQGILGGILGLVGGLAFGQAVAVYLSNLFGTGEFSVQPVISQEVVFLSVLIGVALGILTGILPALRASRVNIVEALRGIKVSFEEKSGRNLVVIGILLAVAGVCILLINGIFDESLQAIWNDAGWDSLDEWRNILLGAGMLFIGLGIILSRFVDRIKAFNLTAIVLWILPVFLFVVAMGNNWITNMSGPTTDILIISIAEIVIGSVMLVGINLSPVMRILRGGLIKVRGVKGVAQVAPALISSHKTRSTLTFAIFAVVLTLNVTVATLVSTNFEGTITQSEEDSKGVDLVVTLSKPEKVLSDTSYTEELYKFDSQIEDVIGIKTYSPTTDFTKFVALKNPYSPEFNPQMDLLPLSFGELTPDQIRGTASDASDPDWRYDFYLSSFPDGVRQPFDPETTDEELLDMSRRAWDLYFDPAYQMPAYNVSFGALLSMDLENIELSEIMEQMNFDLDDVEVLRDNAGSIIANQIVFTDSFILPIGMQVWIPMNTSSFGVAVYQPFTIGGKFDFERAGGFPLAGFSFGGGTDGFSPGDFGGGGGFTLGTLYLPEHWANKTNFLGEANGVTPISRAPNQYNAYLLKTSYAIDDPKLETIAQAIEEFTNTENEGYRKIIDDNFILASATTLYSTIQGTLEMMERMISFLQIYVSFGLVIGAVGMGVISIRNVAERRREIGMMRAIGFPRSQVMISVLLELVVLGLIGLLIGVINGLIINVGFANMQNVTVVIPWQELGTYLTFITAVAIFAGAIPGWVASRIPAAEALRYVG